MTGPYINDLNYEVPENKILVVPHALDYPSYFEEVITPLKGKPQRDWFYPHAYYCLPLTIGNQYGFLINSLRDFEVIWPGGPENAVITFLNNDNEEKQTIKTGFGTGIITIQNRFALKTPPGINLMTIQPPNAFIPGCAAMTGVIECDNIRRDFTFNLKVTVPNLKITIKKGDPIGAFIPIPRYFVDSFEVEDSLTHLPLEMVAKEILESNTLSTERNTVDVQRAHSSGRRYFNGEHSDGIKYTDHQKRFK